MTVVSKQLPSLQATAAGEDKERFAEYLESKAEARRGREYEESVKQHFNIPNDALPMPSDYSYIYAT